MVTTNTWSKGLNSDISKLKTSNETYLDALNITIITQDGDSSYAIQSTKGTKNSFILPSPGPTYRLDFDGITGNVTVNINIVGIGVATTTIVNIQNKTNESIVEQINTAIETAYGVNQVNTIAYFNTNYIVIYDYNNTVTSITLSQGTSERWTYNGGNYLLGWGYSDNELVLVTGDPLVDIEDPENYNNPDISRNGSVGCIWRIPINNSTGQAIRPDGSLAAFGSTLNAVEFLVYKELLNLSRFYNIYKSLKCRKESSKIFRVVYTDFYNDIRTINILEDQVQALPVELINILPVHRPKKPVITKVIEGGFLPTGKYQVWYQLSSFQGATSTISPLSNMIVIGNQEGLANYSGAVVGTTSTKSIEILVEGIDTNYDIVRFGYTVYQVNGLAESFYFDEVAIPTNGTVSTVLNGTEDDIPIDDQVLLSNVRRPPTVAKTLEVVKNHLLIANTKTRQFDVEFDARAYRANATGFSYLYNIDDTYGNPSVIIDWNTPSPSNPDSPDVTIDGVSGFQLTDIPDDYDLINPYNDENPDNPLNGSASPTNWQSNSQYLYQGDATTVGGTGPNISYKFITKDTIEDTNTTTDKLRAPYIAPTYNLDENYDFGTNIQPISGSFSNMRSPYYDSLFWGYARGEVYRWAIVFKDLYGFPSFAYWIGDIKFPTQDEGFPLSEVSANNELICKQIGIEFTLDTTSPQFQAIKDKISGWSFVRVDRTVENKTKLGIGLLDNVALLATELLGPVFCQVHDLTNVPASGEPILDLANKTKILHTPNFHKSIDNQFATGDHIQLLGIYGLTRYQNIVGVNNSTLYNFGFVPRVPAIQNWKNNVTFKWSVPSSRSQNFIPQDLSNGLTVPFVNMETVIATPQGFNSQYSGMGNKCDLITVDTAITPFGGLGQKHCYSYERYLTEQYGGNTRNARYNNTYISTGHYQSYIENQSINPSIVFGGDCVTLLYCYQTIEKNDETVTGWTETSSLYRTAQFFPAEAHGFNPWYQVYAAPFIDSNEASFERTGDTYLYEENIPVNTAYGQVNNTAIFVSKPRRFNNILEEPFTIYASPAKIDGEQFDSWRNFRTNDFISVNGNYGPINRLIEFKDKLYFYQNNGVGIAAINERVLVNEGSTQETQIGVGGVLPRYDYLSTETGVVHQFAVEKSGNSIYHYDALINKAFRLSDGVKPISDIEGLIGFFNNFDVTIKNADKLFIDNPTGVHIAFDSRTNRIFFTLLGLEEQVTISYSELVDGFESRHSFTPNMYLNMRNYFISHTDNAVHLHNVGNFNEYYGVKYPSTIKFRNNLDTPSLVKVFDNIIINAEVIDNGVQTNEVPVDTIRATNDYQDTGVMLSTPIKHRLRTWRWNSLRNQSDRRRMYDKYIDIELSYTPAGVSPNKKLVLHDVILENSDRNTIKPK